MSTLSASPSPTMHSSVTPCSIGAIILMATRSSGSRSVKSITQSYAPAIGPLAMTKGLAPGASESEGVEMEPSSADTFPSVAVCSAEPSAVSALERRPREPMNRDDAK